MMSQRNFLSTTCITLFVVWGAWMASTAPAHAGDWRNPNEADFPAYVKSIKLDGGNVLEAGGNPVCWGNWCVSFGSEPPAATLLDDYGGGHSIFIDPLECRNPVAGVKRCNLILQPPPHNVAFFFGIADAGIRRPNKH